MTRAVLFCSACVFQPDTSRPLATAPKAEDARGETEESHYAPNTEGIGSAQEQFEGRRREAMGTQSDDKEWQAVNVDGQHRQTQDAMEENMNGQKPDLERIRAKYEGKIKIGIDGEHYERNLSSMFSLLREWDPIGHSVAEVEFVLGPPSSMDDQNSLIYHFDSGYVGCSWVFRTKMGRVTKVEKKTNP